MPARITAEEVEAIRAMAAEGLPMREIARRCGRGASTVKRVLCPELRVAEAERAADYRARLGPEEVRRLERERYAIRYASDEEYRRKCSEKSRATERAAMERDPEGFRARRHRRYLANAEVVKERTRAREAQLRATGDESFKQTCLVRSRRRRARKAQVPCDGHTAADLEQHFAAWQGRCAYCFAYIQAGQRHADHVGPIASGGAHVLSNLVPACSTCNTSKGAKPLAEWLWGS